MPFSYVILTRKSMLLLFSWFTVIFNVKRSFYVIMFVIQGDLQGKFEGQIKVKFLTILLETNTNIYFELDKVFLNAFPLSFNALPSLLNAPDSLWRLPIALPHLPIAI